MDGPNRNCEGVARRDFLKLGIGAFAGLGFVDLIQQRVLAKQIALAAGQSSPANVNCILIWLDGGPSHYESFDPKPDAQADIRGELKPIKTAVPGLHFCEVIPKLAKVADKFTTIRSICHKDPNHGGGNHYMMTGAPTPVPVGCGAFVTFHPSYGSVVSWNRGIRNGLPAYISAPQMSRSGGPNFLGAQHAPFIIQGSPNSKDFRVRDVVLPPEISSGRAQTRQQLRQSLDRLARFADKAAEDPAVSFDSYYQQGINLVTSQQAQEAFDLSKEPDAMRDFYGRNDLGQRLLLCRRLVEVGVSFITCYSGGWDHHAKIFDNLDKKLPMFDQGFQFGERQMVMHEMVPIHGFNLPRTLLGGEKFKEIRLVRFVTQPFGGDGLFGEWKQFVAEKFGVMMKRFRLFKLVADHAECIEADGVEFMPGAFNHLLVFPDAGLVFGAIEPGKVDGETHEKFADCL